MTRILHQWRILLICFSVHVFLAGCSTDDGTPELAEVSGTVKMDGQPLSNALIEFMPQDHKTGRKSSGTTDENGYYELKYSLRASGAMLGKHKVSISTEGMGSEYSADGKEIASKQKVPARYNVKSKLTAEVKSGSQEINFLDLESKGEIIEDDDSAMR